MSNRYSLKREGEFLVITEYEKFNDYIRISNIYRISEYFNDDNYTKTYLYFDDGESYSLTIRAKEIMNVIRSRR